MAISEKYLEALGVSQGLLSGTSKLKRALDRAHALRVFEIEMYWKRAAYSWAFQAAAFAGLALSSKKDGIDPPLAMLLSSLGAVTALAALLTAKGSKFWQENWEFHVKFLEGEIEGGLTQLVISKGGVEFSVSRVNERLWYVLFAGWIASFFAAATCLIFPSVMKMSRECTAFLQVGICSVALLAGLAAVRVCTRSQVEVTPLKFLLSSPNDYRQ